MSDLTSEATSLHAHDATNRLEGATSFTNNWAYVGGSIFNQETETSYFELYGDGDYTAPTITYPDDTVFEGNEAEVKKYCLECGANSLVMVDWCSAVIV